MKKRNLTAEQIAARADRRARFSEMVKVVAGMTDAQRAEIINRFGAVLTCEGRALSLHNSLLLIQQRGGAVGMVGGFRQWIRNGRCVRKGERGAMIWIPTGGANTAEICGDAVASPEPSADSAENSRRFVIGTVFDISQTDALAVEGEATQTITAEAAA